MILVMKTDFHMFQPLQRHIDENKKEKKMARRHEDEKWNGRCIRLIFSSP